ncbi:uncharacterized protein LOC142031218 [Buteo buteo]|uniref:uncharacterized protein LOC142030893 n=1 Tax=Buteo buteo TaxID=30397 RepID=UPI003EBF144D
MGSTGRTPARSGPRQEGLLSASEPAAEGPWEEPQPWRSRGGAFAQPAADLARLPTARGTDGRRSPRKKLSCLRGDAVGTVQLQVQLTDSSGPVWLRFLCGTSLFLRWFWIQLICSSRPSSWMALPCSSSSSFVSALAHGWLQLVRASSML